MALPGTMLKWAGQIFAVMGVTDAVKTSVIAAEGTTSPVSSTSGG